VGEGAERPGGTCNNTIPLPLAHCRCGRRVASSSPRPEPGISEKAENLGSLCSLGLPSRAQMSDDEHDAGMANKSPLRALEPRIQLEQKHAPPDIPCDFCPVSLLPNTANAANAANTAKPPAGQFPLSAVCSTSYLVPAAEVCETTVEKIMPKAPKDL